jgi:hypothetical protein
VKARGWSIPLLVLSAVAVAGGVWLLTSEDDPYGGGGEDPAIERSDGPAARPPSEIETVEPRPPVRPLPAGEVPPVGLYREGERLPRGNPDDFPPDRWLKVAPGGTGAVTGAEVLAAIERDRLVYVRATSEAVLKRVRAAVLHGVDRERGIPYVALEMAFHPAGVRVHRRDLNAYVLLEEGDEREIPPPEGDGSD